VGSGYIAVELAGILNALGSDVTLVIRYNKVLRSFEAMLSDELMVAMTDAGVKLAKFSKVTAHLPTEGGKGGFFKRNLLFFLFYFLKFLYRLSKSRGR